MADRFYRPDLSPTGPIVLEGDEAKHLAKVARRDVGDQVEVFDGRGLGVLARVGSIARDRVVLTNEGPIPDRRAPLELTLCVAPPKGERFDWLVEKATEIGVVRLVPIRAQRSVVDPRAGKLDRLRRVVVEACKQCGRNRLMTIAEPVAFAAMVREVQSETRLLAEIGGFSPRAMSGRTEGRAVTLAIGPEGGWTTTERNLARDSGWREIDLGATRLRVETAAIVGAAVLIAMAGEGLA